MSIEYPQLWRVLSQHFQLGPWTIHGPDHWKRVERNGLDLAKVTQADETVVRLFAVFHDSCRRSDATDPQHGQRAAQLALDTHGELFAVTGEQLELLVAACNGHHLGETSDHITIGTCWDADRLDLPRCGVTPDAFFMSTAEGKRLARLLRSSDD